MQNYHKHTHYSNIMTPDCVVTPEHYIERELELGRQVISTVEHGFQSNYYDYYDKVTAHNEEIQRQFEAGEISEEEKQKKTLKFVFGTEAYWVKDRQKEYEYTVMNAKGEEEVRTHKDRSNCHIILLAKNEEGRRDINEALSEANISGWYVKPRVDLELLFKIKPENVMVTTACVKYWTYDDIEDITLKLNDHFKGNFYLEVQYHNTDKQKEINRNILRMHYQYGIPIICGLDSHYIREEDAVRRDDYIKGRGIDYDSDEEGWYMDDPSDEVIIQRFQEQGVLSDTEIKESMDNCDIILTFDDITFDKDIKLPSCFPDKSQEYKDALLRKIIYDKWNEVKKDIDPARWAEYEEGIEYELDAIFSTKMTDYFLIDNRIISKGIAKGGVVTQTGRGSAVSYYVNSLLGFSSIDRFISPVKLYPDRFISKTRILKTRSLPDIDMNLGTVEPFAQAQDEVLTEAYGSEGHSYPMISYKPLQTSSAFKLYAKSQGMDFNIANGITEKLKQYEKDLKHADTPEDKEKINIYNYINPKYHKYLDESKQYQKIINTKSPAPCGYLIYQGDIKREIGLIRCVSGTGKNQKSVLTTVIDGAVAEKYKFVKNDLLKVEVWNIINEICRMVGIPVPKVNEMAKYIEGDEPTWNIYSTGYTCGVNQFESDFGKGCCRQYKPRNIQELTALVAALRPGFKTQLNNFLERKPYTTGVKELDDLLEDSFHYIMYQENIMTYLGWLGIEQTETYDIIKKISKKKFKEKELAELKQRLGEGWKKQTGRDEGFEQTWSIMEAFASYAFNASHSLSYAYDSVYGAYLKAHYPYEFYTVMLQTYSDKGDKKRVADFASEMLEAFGIKEGEYKFRQDNRYFKPDKREKKIIPSLSCVKGIGAQVAEELYQLRNADSETFTDFILYAKEHSNLGLAMIGTLVKIDYFSEFGNIRKLLTVLEVFDHLYDKTNKRFIRSIKKDKVKDYGLTDEIVQAFSKKQTEKTYMMVDCYGMLREMETIEFVDITSIEKASYEQQFLNRCRIRDPYGSNICVIGDVNDTKTPRINAYSLKNGGYYDFKIQKQIYGKANLVEGDVIKCTGWIRKPKVVFTEEGKPVKDEKQKELWATGFHLIHKGEKHQKISSKTGAR